MRFREAARLLDYDVDTLRGLERRGVLPAVPRDHNGHRHFSREDIRTWRKILMTPPAPDQVPIRRFKNSAPTRSTKRTLRGGQR